MKINKQSWRLKAVRCLLLLSATLLPFSVYADNEPNTRAMRVVSLPLNVEDLGSYSISAETGTIAAGASANAPIFSFRWSSTSKVAVIRSVRIGAASLATGFTAGTTTCGIIAARSFTASDTGGTALTLTTNNAKLKTSFGTTLAGDIRISDTAALSAGTRTLDAQDLTRIGPYTTTNAAQTNFIPSNTDLYGRDVDGAWPLTLVQDEGFVVRCTVPATGTWKAVISVDWTELYRFP